MQQSYQHHKLGLGKCFEQFYSVYCYRKLIQFILSIILILTSIIVLTIYIKNNWIARPYWLSSLLLTMILALITNIIFCFFNNYYWIYAIEVYFKNMYFLILVSYICYNYLLKHTPQQQQDLMQQLNINMNIPHTKEISNQKIIFYIIVSILIGGYLGILITSLVYEIQHQKEEEGINPNNGSNMSYCQETWYLILHVVCVVLSGVVIWVMVKSQKEEYQKIIIFQNKKLERKARAVDIREVSVGSSQPNYGSYSQKTEEERRRESDYIGKIHNPFKKLWIWVGVNVGCQILNLVQSGLQLNLKPPMCMIVPDNANESNAIALVFVLLTFYLQFIVTIWYIVSSGLNSRTELERTVLYSEEYRLGDILVQIASSQSRGMSQTLSLHDQL